MNTLSLQHIETLRREIESALDSTTQFSADCPDRLREAIRYSLLAPGKRLRPILVLTAYELCCEPNNDTQNNDIQNNAQWRLNATHAACAVEMIHAYSLIHDDLPAMDNDDMRRGLPTCHRKFDEATAILAGDALLALAFEMIGNLTPPKLAGQCCKALAVAAGACQLVGGQMDDVLHSNKYSIESMEHIHHRKTGALIRTSLKLGGMIAGASTEQMGALDEFGKHFGLAFQITDDLLDVLGDEAMVGKRLRKDADMNKWSYPHILGIEESKQIVTQSVRDAEMALTMFKQDSVPRQVLLDLLKHLPERVK